MSPPAPTATLASALKLVALGYPPVRCTLDTKVANTGHGLRDATLDESINRERFAVRCNLGAGWPRGVLGIDVDVPEDEHDEPLSPGSSGTREPSIVASPEPEMTYSHRSLPSCRLSAPPVLEPAASVIAAAWERLVPPSNAKDVPPTSRMRCFSMRSC
jgi:hypothetical protein